ncbi:MAG TPA: FeoB-associated Cys-rich membrane protein [Flavobacterium sp.]|nr:FeoB-associated Cys-rich membrane protein [Flavobacterium sp.]
MMQDIIVYVLAICATAYLLRKFVFKKKAAGCGDNHNCKCG